MLRPWEVSPVCLHGRGLPHLFLSQHTPLLAHSCSLISVMSLKLWIPDHDSVPLTLSIRQAARYTDRSSTSHSYRLSPRAWCGDRKQLHSLPADRVREQLGQERPGTEHIILGQETPAVMKGTDILSAPRHQAYPTFSKMYRTYCVWRGMSASGYVCANLCMSVVCV